MWTKRGTAAPVIDGVVAMSEMYTADGVGCIRAFLLLVYPYDPCQVGLEALQQF